jgi:hypothetical protein
MRLVTRGNLDGLCCSVLITECENIDSIELIHPQEITDGLFAARTGDILANLPYHPNCFRWFDHHSATKTYESPPTEFEGKYGMAPSTARLVYAYYRREHPDLERFTDYLDEVDRYHGAVLKRKDVTDPEGYILLGHAIDPRSNLGVDKDFFLELVGLIKEKPIDDILKMEVVKRRVERITEDRQAFIELLRRCSRQSGSVVITDLRGEEKLPAGNRFLIYTLFPEANVSLQIAWGPDREYVMATVGHSIFNRTCSVHLGELMAKYGGGGHGGAGATPLPTKEAERLLEQMIEELQGKSRSA